MLDQLERPVFLIELVSNDHREATQPIAKRTPYGKGTEAKSVKDELGGFMYERSAVYISLVKHFGPSIRLRELRGIVLAIKDVLEKQYGCTLPPVSRNTKRIFSLLVKYMHDNYVYFMPMLDKVSLCDANLVPIQFDDSQPLVARKLIMPCITVRNP